MNIQLPVVLWTVICFIALMLILKFLLFNPVFEVMDKRKARIDAAKKKKEQAAAITEEHEKRLEIIAEDAKIQRENFINGELKLIRIKTKTETAEAKAARFARVEAYKKETEAQKEGIKNQFSSSVEDIAKAFAERLISD